MYKNIFLFFLLYLFLIVPPMNLNATTYTTKSSGYWNNNNPWQNGVAPPLSTSDTIIIKNFIVITSNIELLGNAYLRIDSSGALCGHDTIFSNAGSSMTTYGILECDVLWVPGGHILFSPPGYIVLTQYAHLSNGASLNSSTNLNVGPWFDCVSEISGIQEYNQHLFNIYPNPVQDLLNFYCDELIDDVFISDLSGRILLRRTQKNNSIDIEILANGYYVLTLKSKGNIFQKKFFKNKIH